MKIIYKDGDGVIVLSPTQDCLKTHTIDEIAKKDVPSGLPYKIIEDSDLPDRTFRNAWEVDEATLTDGVGSDSSKFEGV